MRKISYILTVLLLVCVTAKGQTSPVDGGYGLYTRTSLGIDWKLAKKFHLEAKYELRTEDRLSGIERHQLSTGLSYSPVKHLDIGAGYCFIGHFDNDKKFKPSHRLFFDVSGSYRFGAWKLNLRERIQGTYKDYDFNEYQKTPFLVELKSRLKLSYKGLIHLEPYVYAELRNCFNDPSFSADYNESTGKYSNYQFTGYTDANINRLRGALGLEWKINSRHSLDIKFMTDWCRSKEIDTNEEGTKLKSFAWEHAMKSSLSFGYVFSF